MKQMRIAVAVFGLLTALSFGYAEKRAILIQVVKYRDPKINSYTGGTDAESLDVATMKRTLERYQFRSFIELSDSQATREAILQAMEDVRRETKPGDVVVFYFSGHGTASDEGISIAPYDAVAQNPSNDITAKDLADWVRQLSTDHVVIFLDCCFYFVPPPRPYLISAKLITERVGKERPGWGELIRLEKGVVITATDLDSPAYQYYTGTINPKTGQFQWLGFYTSALSMELERASQQGKQLTYEQLHQHVARKVNAAILRTGHRVSQSPRIWGGQSLLSSPVFGSSGNSVPSDSTSSASPTEVQPVKVYLDPSVPEQLREQLVRDLFSAPNTPVAITDTRFGATYLIVRIKNQIVLTDPYGSMQSVLMTLEADNALPTKSDSAAVSQTLSELAVNHITLRLLLNLYANHFAEEQKHIWMDTDESDYRIGDTLKVKIALPQSGYLILVSQTADGKLSLLFPYEGTENPVFLSGQLYMFPMEVGLVYRVLGPVGINFICAILVRSQEAQRDVLCKLQKGAADCDGTIRKGLEVVRDIEEILQKLISERKCELGYITFPVRSN